MKNVSGWLEEKLVPIAVRLSNNLYISSLRDGFAAIMPAMIIGSFLTLLMNMPIPGYKDFMFSIFGDAWMKFFNDIFIGTVPLVSLLATASISYHLSKKIGCDTISSMITALMLYFIFLPAATVTEGETAAVVANSYSSNYMGAKGFFIAILLGLFIPVLLKKLSGVKFLAIRLPDSVPPSVLTSFLILIPVFLLTVGAGVLKSVIAAVSGVDVFTFVYTTLQTPLREIVGTSYAGGLISVLFTYAAWFFGIHGGLLMGPINSVIFGELMPANIEAFQAGAEIPNFFTGIPFFEIFTKIGGGGNVLALVIAVLLVAKTAQYREVAKVGMIPSLFNIIEPMVFGMPIVFNPILAIPFVLAPVVTYTLAYLGSMAGIIAPIVIQVPWTIPTGINIFLSTAGDMMSVVCQLALLALSVLIYIPFIKISEKAMMQNQEAEA